MYIPNRGRFELKEMRKLLVLILVLCFCITHVVQVSYGKKVFTSEEELLEDINKDIQKMYGKTEYFKESVSVGGITYQLNRENLGTGFQYANAIAQEGIEGGE